MHGAASGIAFVGRFCLIEILLRVIKVPQHQVSIFQPRQRVEILASFRQVHALVEIHGGLIGHDVGIDEVLPHSEA